VCIPRDPLIVVSIAIVAVAVMVVIVLVPQIGMPVGVAAAVAGLLFSVSTWIERLDR
jgi:hypothetical protein